MCKDNVRIIPKKKIEITISGDGTNSVVMDLSDDEIKVLCKIMNKLNDNVSDKYDPKMYINVIKDRVLVGEHKNNHPFINPLADALKNIHLNN